MAEIVCRLFDKQRELIESFREKGELLTKEEITDIFERVDIDKNGSINYWEFVAAATKASTLLCNENLKIAFEVFDKNNSGAISAEEIRGLFYNNQQQIQDGDEVDESVIDAIIQQVDENGDGEICFEEFSKMMQENLLTNKRPHDSASTESESVNQRPRQCPSLTLEKG